MFVYNPIFCNNVEKTRQILFETRPRSYVAVTYRPLGCRESELWKNCAEPFAPRAKGISLGVGTHPSSLTSHSKFRSASAFFNIYLTAVVRNACAFTYLPTAQGLVSSCRNCSRAETTSLNDTLGRDKSNANLRCWCDWPIFPYTAKICKRFDIITCESLKKLNLYFEFSN